MNMNKKAAFIALLVVVFISVIGTSVYFLKEGPMKEPTLARFDTDTTMSGKVFDISYSALVIFIERDERNEEGVFDIALDDDTRLISVDGSQISLREIRPGMHIRATGKLASKDGLLAREVRVLSY